MENMFSSLTTKGAVHALDLSTGASAWKQDQLAGRGAGRPRGVGEHVVVG
jgi:outer membrane protein assembly factor BamB